MTNIEKLKDHIQNHMIISTYKKKKLLFEWNIQFLLEKKKKMINQNQRKRNIIIIINMNINIKISIIRENIEVMLILIQIIEQNTKILMSHNN